MNQKLIVVLLVLAIIISVFSMIVTLSLNAKDLQIEKTATIIKEPASESANVGLSITKNNENT